MDALQIISIVMAILCMLIIIIVGLRTNLLREVTAENKPYSFSRVQTWLWSLIICPAFALNWGFNAGNIPFLNNTSLILLGITVAVAASSQAITQAQTKSANRTITLKHEQETSGFWTDILTDDSKQFSIGRLQHFIFTLIFIVIYISLFFKNEMKTYPEFQDTAFILMGISSGGYLVGKGLNK